MLDWREIDVDLFGVWVEEYGSEREDAWRAVELDELGAEIVLVSRGWGEGDSGVSGKKDIL